MKTFIGLVIVAVIAGGGWYWLSNNNETEVSVEATESPIATLPGLGGEGPEPINFTEPPEATAEESVQPIATPTRVPPVFRTPTPTPTPSPAPLLVFREVTEMNATGEHGVMLVTADAQGRAVINFNVVGTPAGVIQPAYIYRGANCQVSGEVIFGINPLMNGSSMTILPIRATELLFGSGDPLRLVVHLTADNTTRAACAVIR